ncbi:Uncharacterised protein [Vibrio cholerae]|nr:Uncharacterised protein [Vibrio cholerae]
MIFLPNSWLRTNSLLFLMRSAGSIFFGSSRPNSKNPVALPIYTASAANVACCSCALRFCSTAL